MLQRALSAWGVFIWPVVSGSSAEWAHHESAQRFQKSRQVAAAKAAALAEDPANADSDCSTWRLTTEILDSATGNPLAGLVRITKLDSGEAVKLPGWIDREMNWHATASNATVTVLQIRLKVEAFHGIETELRSLQIDLTGRTRAAIQLVLKQFYNPRSSGLRSANTHLHLMKMTNAEAIRYLRLMP